MINVTIGNNQGRETTSFDINTTIREAFEERDMEYGNGSISLDGATISGSGLDKTFAEYGYADGGKCYLFCTIKTQCAADGDEVSAPVEATAKIVGNMLMVQSGMKLADIKKVMAGDKEQRNALAIFKGEGEKKEEIFRVSVAPRGTGSACNNGVSFASATAEGFAVLTMPIPAEVVGIDEAKEWAAAQIGGAVIKLRQVEKQAAVAIEAIDAEKAAVLASIDVL